MNRADLNAGAGWGFKQIRGCEYTGGSSVVGVDTYEAEGGEKDRKEAERLPGIINNAEHHYIR